MTRPTVHLICNAHLDPVWQWRWEEGCAEALATFATAATLLGEHPDLIFNHNEAVLYEWVREHDPALFGKIRALVAAGRWAISGGWYLQPDVNLPDTESLIRHIAVGRRFFREHFGAAPVVAYNFDSFGHSAGLPQLLVRSGFKMYIHMRPQDPDLKLPSDLYRWRGLDGSEIAALRIAVGLYHTERDNIEQRLTEGVDLALRLNRDVPVFWGIGNHGGGPTREDLGRIDAFMRRETRVGMVHSTPDRLYEALREPIEAAPVVEGDLQRVFTGCYTSLARVKRQAVTSLARLVQTEALRTATWWQKQNPYPDSVLEAAWRDHLFNDFHDILPGSCVAPAEEDALNLYGKVQETSRRLLMGAATAFNQGPPQPCYVPLTILHANPACPRLPVEAECMLDLRPKWTGTWHLRLFTLDGSVVPCQEEQPESLLPFNGWRRKVCFFADLPGLGAKHYKLEIFAGPAERAVVAPGLPHRLDSRTGLVTSLESGPGRECLREPMLKLLVVEDPGDAWGTGQWSYRRLTGEFKCDPKSVLTVEQGPVRTVTESVHQFGQSRIVLRILAYAGWPVLEFRLRIHWAEERRRLKLSIPTVFRNEAVLCEVPGGASLRPADGQEHVHRRWLLLEGALQDQTTALAIVHDGCHGFDYHDGEIRLSVLRSPAYCHEQGFTIEAAPARKYMDQGLHEVRLLITAGDATAVRNAVPGLADWLSAPPAVYAHLPIGRVSAGNSAGSPSLLTLHPAHVRMLACKRSWDGRAVVVRLQETAGLATEASFQFGAMRAPVRVSLPPHAIKTLRVGPGLRCREVDLISEK